MKLSHRVSLDNSQMDQLDASIAIRGVEIGEADVGISAVNLEGDNGQRVTGMRRNTLDVTVKFAIDKGKRDMAGREQVLQLVKNWAAAARYEQGGAWLRVNYKSGKRLRVYLAKAPAEGDLWDWTKDFEMVFRAYRVPYWQDVTATEQTLTAGTSGSGSITVNGEATAKAEATLENTSNATMDTATIKIGKSEIGFEDLGLAAGESLEIDHTAEDLLRIRIKNTSNVYRSAMAKRTTGSAHDFFVEPGSANITFTAGKTAQLTVSVKGRYL